MPVKEEQRRPAPSGAKRRVREDKVPDDRPVPNEYYARVSGRFRVSKYLFLILLVVYLVVMLASYSDSITYANMKFLLKDFNTTAEGTPGDFSSVRFEKQQNMDFTLLRGSLAVSGTSRLTLYSPGMDTGLEYLLGASQPIVLPSEKYLLVYDLGARQYGLYTSLANVYSAETEHDITGGAISKSGAYALITRSTKAKYQLTLWDASFRQIGTYYAADAEDYIFDAAISDDADSLVLVTASVSLSSFRTRVLLARVGETSYCADVVIEGEMPLSVSFFENGGFAVVCDRNVWFFDEDGRTLGSVPTTGLNLSAASADRLLLVSSDNVVGSENDVTVLDPSGKCVFASHVSAQLRDAALADDGCVYLLGTDRVFRLTENGRIDEEPCSGNTVRLLAGDGYVLLCRQTGVSTAFADDGKE